MEMEMGLKTIADTKNISLGCGVTAATLNLNTSDRFLKKWHQTIYDNFQWIVPLTAWKFKTCSPSPGVYDWSQADIVYDFAIAHNLKVRGHALMWNFDRPKWMQEMSRLDQNLHLKAWATTLMTRYGSVVDTWDVAGEFGTYLLNSKLTYANNPQWTDIEESGEVVREIFTLARSLAPQSQLMYWDWGLRSRGRWEAVVAFVNSIPECDGISRVIRFNDPVREWQYQKGKYNGNTELTDYQGIVELSEIKIGLKDNTLFPNLKTREAQARAYSAVLRTAYLTGCRAFGFWDACDRGSPEKPGLWDKGLNPKPAYDAVKSFLENL